MKPTIDELRAELVDDIGSQHVDNLYELDVANPYVQAFRMANYRDAPLSPLISL